MKRAIIISSQEGNWEGLFLDGKLMEQGHKIGDGDSVRFWLDFGNKNKISGYDLLSVEAHDIDEEMLMETGAFPQSLSELHEDYANLK